MANQKVVIIGGGPTGLGAAHRLRELGYDNWALYEKSDDVGGHSTSHVDPQGFVWDEGGHVIFSHYPYFDKLIDDLLGKEVYERVRESWVYLKDSCVPYPFQNNLRYLPRELQVSCLVGAAKAAASRNGDAANFREWVLHTFGEGIADAFMFPYNSKVWTTPPERMSKGWIAERVPVVDFKRLLENVLYEKDDVSWGPNNKFRFPLRGGTGEIYRRMARGFLDRVRTGKQLAEIDTAQRKVSFTDGTGDSYDVLISTAPLDLLAGMLKPADSKLRDAAALLEHNDLLVIGFGLKKKIETGKCWVYFVDADMPCYRASFFSFYSPNHVPQGDTEQYSSLMCEMSLPLGKEVNIDRLCEQTLDGLIRHKILEEADRSRIVSRYHRLVRYSYPIPTIDRDRALAILQPALERQGIYSRGRFGAWRYEIGNMDHSVMMGVEAANHVVNGEKEVVFYSA